MSSFIDMDEEVKTCRICFEPETNADEMISPCDCSGSQKYVHNQCLSHWQATVLFQETSTVLNETRHLICNTCGAYFRGLSIPTRMKLLSSVCGEEVAASLQVGSFLVASRSNSERAVSTNFPALVTALFNLKRAHWKYGVYFIFSYGDPDMEDVEGTSKVFALNLTRLMDGSPDRPIPDEVLNQQELLKTSQGERKEGVERKKHVATIGDGKSESDDLSDDCFPYVTIKHHNGGPVKWSSFRSGMFVVEKDVVFVQEQLRRRGFESDEDAVARSGIPGAVFLSSFLLIPLSDSSCLVIGKFSIIMEIIQAILHLFADGSERVVFSFSGYAEWTKAQLLREVARGSWGVVRPETALRACEELLCPSSTAYPTAHPPTVDDLSEVAKVASISERLSCNAKDDEINEGQDDKEKEHNHQVHDQAGNTNKIKENINEKEEDSKVTLALHQSSDDNDELPPIPLPVRIATRGSSGSVTRARSASNTAASASGTSDGPDVLSTPSSSAWRDMFIDLDEGNIWSRMIDTSLESGDNVIRQSYS